MVVREPSAETIYDLLAGGKLGERQIQVYQGFQSYGDHTNLELSRLIQVPINVVTPRTNELVKLGLLEMKYKRACTITGRRSIVWGVMIKKYSCKSCGVTISKEQAIRTYNQYIRVLCVKCEAK